MMNIKSSLTIRLNRLGAGTAMIYHRTWCTEAYAKATNNDKCITRTIRLDNK